MLCYLKDRWIVRHQTIFCLTYKCCSRSKNIVKKLCENVVLYKNNTENLIALLTYIPFISGHTPLSAWIKGSQPFWTTASYSYSTHQSANKRALNITKLTCLYMAFQALLIISSPLKEVLKCIVLHQRSGNLIFSKPAPNQSTK